MARVKVRQFPIHPKQAEFRNSSAWIRGFCGGRGVGKTRIGSYDMIVRARDTQTLMVVGPDYGNMMDASYGTFREVAEELNVVVEHYKSPPPHFVIRTLDGGRARVVFRSADKPDNLVGPNLAGLWLDEASLMSSQIVPLLLPALRHKGKRGWLSMTFTPKGRKHWTYGEFFDENGSPREHTELIRAHSRENPWLDTGLVDMIEDRFTSRMQAQELAGEFLDIEGLMFNRLWFGMVESSPSDAVRVRYWDKAASLAPGSARTCGLLMAMRRHPRTWFIEDVITGHWSPHQRNNLMLETAKGDAARYGNTVQIHVEQEGGSGGKESMQETYRLLAGFPVHRDWQRGGQQTRVVGKEQVPGLAKIRRAEPLATQCEAGNVKVVRAPWNDEYFAEMCAFPEYNYADQVDASSGAFAALMKDSGLTYAGPPDSGEVEEEREVNKSGLRYVRSGGFAHGIPRAGDRPWRRHSR